MTEPEWLITTDPTRMLEFLQGKVSDRKLRLFACGCCHLVWDWLVHSQSRDAVLASEAFADGLISVNDLTYQNYKAEGAVFAIDEHQQRYRREQRGIVQGWLPEEDCVTGNGYLCASGTRIPFESAHMAANAAEFTTSSFSEFLSHTHPAILSEPLVRDIFSTPFHPVTIPPEWRTDTAVSLARQMYESRDFSPMPILADALQDAGCDNEDILNHCRGPGPHVRAVLGCRSGAGQELIDSVHDKRNYLSALDLWQTRSFRFKSLF